MSAAPAILQGTPEWLEARTQCITATDIAAILGLHPYKSPAQVYLQKTGQLGEKEPNDSMLTGTHLEPSIAQWFAFKHRVVPTRADFCLHPTEPIFGASPDYFVEDDAVLECKWVGQHAAQGFGEGPDEVPTHYLLQVQWQCFVTGRSRWHLCVLGPWGFREYEGPADPELHTRMAFHARKFWHEYVKAELSPPLTGQPADTKWLKEQYPESNGNSIAASYELEETIQKLKLYKETDAELALKIAECENQLKAFMGEAETMESTFGKFRWASTKPKVETDWQLLCMDLHAALKKQGIEIDLVAHAANYSETKPGYRRFTTPFRSERA